MGKFMVGIIIIIFFLKKKVLHLLKISSFLNAQIWKFFKLWNLKKFRNFKIKKLSKFNFNLNYKNIKEG